MLENSTTLRPWEKANSPPALMQGIFGDCAFFPELRGQDSTWGDFYESGIQSFLSDPFVAIDNSK